MLIWSGWLLALLIRYSPYGIELLAILLLARVSWPARHLFGSMHRAFDNLARRRRLAILATGIAALAGRAMLLPVLPTRAPAITDEFSYLIAADTFSHGRITNPPHPQWMHFETIHVLQKPTYASMYHVAQGLILATGRIVLGSAWAGVYLSVAVMCALLCWMLQAWLPPRWALLGGLLGVLRLGLFGYWINSYWGGTAAACGGLLVLGAMPRIQRYKRIRDALLLAGGMVVLANSRPYEGFVLSLTVTGWLVAWLWRQPDRVRLMAKLLAPVVLVLALSGTAMGYYYWRVTGNPLRMPYQADRDQYAPAGIFLWERPRTIPEYRHESLRRFYVGWELSKFQEAKTPAGFVKNTFGKAAAFWMFFLGPALTTPLIFGRSLFRDRRMRPLIVITAVFLAALLLNTWFYAHYAAPLVGAIYALVLQGIRHLRAAGSQGKALARAVVLVCLGMTVLRVAIQPLAFYMPPDWPMTWYYTRPGNTARADMETELRKKPGNHLLLVRYRPDHNALEEWVYNEASIDSAKVVWAREMNPENNRELLDYFKERDVWLVEPDATPPAITAWTGKSPAK